MVSPAVATALQADGLLTLALQKAYGLTSSVEFRRNAGWTDVRFEVGLRRDVLMKTGDSMNIDEYYGCQINFNTVGGRFFNLPPVWLP